MTVHSLAARRKRHDDGRCHHPACGGVYRAVCPFKGAHPVFCPHTDVIPARTYLLHGWIEQIAPPRCRYCGQHLYRETDY